MPVQSILIVDDEANQRLMFEQALQSPQLWSIVTAANGYEALEYIATHTPDLILTDYNMMTMNGLELITQLRARAIASRVILMTAYSSQELKEAAEHLQVDYYLAKPVPLKTLRSLIAETMHGAQSSTSSC